MNSTKTKLKPLAQKKALRQEESPLAKVQDRKALAATLAKDEEPSAKFPKVKYVKSSSRPATAIELYNCDDMDDLSALEDDAYFEKQLQKNIKTETAAKKPTAPVSKNQILLPKLEGGEGAAKQSKDIEREMDLEMSRILDEEI